MTLVGDTGISLGLTTSADRTGRKRILIAGAALMSLGGLVFVLTGNFLLLLLAATIGVLSPSGNEVGPFLAIEQSARYPQTVAAEERTRMFAWYHLAGSFATAAGSLACGVFVQFLQAQAIPSVQSFRVVLFGYATAGMLLAVLFLRRPGGGSRRTSPGCGAPRDGTSPGDLGPPPLSRRGAEALGPVRPRLVCGRLRPPELRRLLVSPPLRRRPGHARRHLLAAQPPGGVSRRSPPSGSPVGSGCCGRWCSPTSRPTFC